MRTKVSAAATFLFAAFAVLGAGRAQAACAGTPDDRDVVGYIPDIVLTAGVPEVRAVVHSHVVRRAAPVANAPSPPFSECGAVARSNLRGLSIRSTYFDFGAVHGPGEWAGLNGSHHTEGSPIVLSGIRLELVFDGSAPAGAVGTVEIAQRSGGEITWAARLMTRANVYVVAPGAALPQTWFTATADAPAIFGARLVLDHPLLNGAGSNLIFVTHAHTKAVPRWPHPLSVRYDATLARWTIVNDDGATMPPGIAFHVRIDPSAMILSRPRRHPGRPSARLRIDDPRANYNPFAVILVTPASPNAHPIAVRYDAPHWSIVNADGAAIGTQRFHVQIHGAGAYRDDRFRRARPFDPLGTNGVSNGLGVDASGIGPARTSGDSRFIDLFWALGAPRPMIVTPNLTPYGRSEIAAPSFVSVWATGATAPTHRAAVAQATGAPMPNTAGMNLWSQPAPVRSVRNEAPPISGGGVHRNP
jgi:hypothetical protein